jgi:hypothetical protein
MADMSQSSGTKWLRVNTSERRRVLEVARAVSALAEQSAHAVEGEFVYVGELVGGSTDRLRTVAVYRDEGASEDFTQDLPSTASYRVLVDGTATWSAGASRIFPLDPLITNTEAEGFAGVRLCDAGGKVLGMIGVVNRNPFRDTVEWTPFLRQPVNP